MKEKSLLVLDTNIISNALNTNKRDSYFEWFKELEKKYTFAVTGFTKYELLRSSSKENREKINEYIKTSMGYAPLNMVLMDFSARVNYLYKKHKATKHLNISDGDIINGAFSIASDAHLMTIDNNDYPRPFFLDVRTKEIVFTSSSNRKATDHICILKPDLSHIKRCFGEHKV